MFRARKLVSVLFTAHLTYSALRHIRLLNTPEQKPITNSRDTQELHYEAGCEVLQIFLDHQTKSKTSLLQDFAYYEVGQDSGWLSHADHLATLGSAWSITCSRSRSITGTRPGPIPRSRPRIVTSSRLWTRRLGSDANSTSHSSTDLKPNGSSANGPASPTDSSSLPINSVNIRYTNNACFQLLFSSRYYRNRHVFCTNV